MKTLEELGYKITYDNGRAVRYNSEEHCFDFIYLESDGSISFGADVIVNQEMFKAIEAEMKKRKWWK